MKKLLAFALCASALVSSSALAQVPTIVRSVQPYVPLPGTAPNTGLAGDDVGTSPAIALGFTFPYFGQNYTHVVINSNGIIVPMTSSTATNCTSGCLGNTSFPSTTNSFPIIAGFWDDLDLRSSGSVRYLASGGEFTVEWIAVPRYSYSANTVTFQVKLSASGAITVHYGSITGTSSNWNFSSGFQSGGTSPQGANLLTCASQSSCVGTEFPASGTLIRIGEPDQADLGVASVAYSNLSLDGGNVAFTLNAGLRNYGRTEAPNFNWKAYISRDTQLNLTSTDGGLVDQEVASGGPETLPAVDGGVTADGGLALVNVTAAAITTTPPATGEYYVLVQADSDDTVTEASESNNVGASATSFIIGADLVANSISGPASTGGGNTENFPISFTNRGTDPANNVQFRILLSLDQVLDSSDFPVFTGTRTVGPGNTNAETVQVTIPNSAPNGNFYWLLQIDPTNTLTEANETNNAVASSTKVDVLRADLVAEAASFLDPVTNLPISTARFGDVVQFRVRYRNTGGANANNFKIALVLSSDSSLSLLSDTYVCDQSVTLLAPSANSSETTLSCTLPLRNTQNRDFPTGIYYLFGIVDASGAVYEINKTNNQQMIGPVRLTAPGPDLAVTSVTAPASAGVGEIIPVVRTVRNLGNLDAPQVAYRYYASANDIITPDDVLLKIVTGTMEKDEGTLTLTRGSSDTATELVRLPGSMPAGTYYVGCIVDPTATVLNDLEPANNALPSRSMVVAPSSLRIVNTVLPDAVVGRPYSFRLSASGEQGPSTWRIEPLLGGAPPAWLSIGATDGLLTGTPPGSDGQSVVGVTVVLENSGRQTATRLALRVLPTTSTLDIVTASLPAVVNSSTSQYQYQLGASGGVRPYAWRVASGTLPTGLALGADGLLFGSPRNASNGSITLTFEVRDAVGGVALRQLPLRLVAPGSLKFRTISIPDALVGQEYLQDIAVEMQDGSALSKPLTWRVSGALPLGLLTTPATDLITISGRPTQAGTFTFTLSVEDNSGRSDSLEYTMTVHPPRYRVTATIPEVVRPSEAVNITLAVAPTGQVTYRVVGGVLPPGLTLDPAGTITGTVAPEGAEGLWSFVVEAADRNGMSGLSPLAIRVERAPRATGCSSTGAPGTLGLLLAGLALLRRRRS